MKFADFIKVTAIKADMTAEDKPEAIRELVQALSGAGAIAAPDVDGIVAAIMKREELGSTGIGRGVAVPHTKHPSVERLVGPGEHRIAGEAVLLLVAPEGGWTIDEATLSAGDSALIQGPAEMTCVSDDGEHALYVIRLEPEP